MSWKMIDFLLSLDDRRFARYLAALRNGTLQPLFEEAHRQIEAAERAKQADEEWLDRFAADYRQYRKHNPYPPRRPDREEGWNEQGSTNDRERHGKT